MYRARENSTSVRPLLASSTGNSVSEITTPLRLGVDPHFTDRERQPGLHLLRAFAIIVVVIYHAALFGFKLPRSRGSIRLDRGGSILRSQRLSHRRAIARAAHARSANRPVTLLCPSRLANHPGLLRHPRSLCLFAVVA